MRKDVCSYHFYLFNIVRGVVLVRRKKEKKGRKEGRERGKKEGRREGREDEVRMGEAAIYKTRQEASQETKLPTPSSWASGLQNCERRTFRCLSPLP